MEPRLESEPVIPETWLLTRALPLATWVTLSKLCHNIGALVSWPSKDKKVRRLDFG